MISSFTASKTNSAKAGIMNSISPGYTPAATKTDRVMKIKSSKRFQIHNSLAGRAIFGVVVCVVLCATNVRAGVVSTTFTLQQGNLQQDGSPYGSGNSYSGMVDGSINDGNPTAVYTATTTVGIGNAYKSPNGLNGQQFVGLYAYNLTELNNFIAANTSAHSSVQVVSVSLQLISNGGANNSSSSYANLYQTQPFTGSANWNTTDGSTAWSSPLQSGQTQANYGWTGGGSPLTSNLGGTTPQIISTLYSTPGNPITWGSSATFISVVTSALARTDHTLYLMSAPSFLSNADGRVYFYKSNDTTPAHRPVLTITLQVTTTAQPTTWTGTSDTSWTTAGNWFPSTVPLTDAPIIFNGSSTAHLNTVLNQNFTVLSLSVTNPTGPVSIGGASSLTIDTGGIDLSAATQDLTISAPVVLGVGQTWNVAASRTLSINGGVSGSAALTIAGSGTVSLGGADTATADTTISAGGTLQMGAANVLPNAAGAGNVNVIGLLDLNGNAEAVNGLNGSGVVDNTAVGAATLTVGNNNTNSSFSGTIADTGGALALVKTGTGTLTLSGANTYSGGTTIANGTVVPGNGSAFGTGTVTVDSGATAYPVTSMTLTNPLVLNGGHFELGGNNDTAIWSGPVSVNNSFSMSGDNGNCQMYLSGPMDIGTGGILVTNSGNSGPNGSSTSGLGDILSGTISGSGGITYYVNGGNSRLTVQGANTYSGDTVVNGTSNGKLNVYGGINPFSTGTVTLNAGAVIEAYPSNVTITNSLTLNGGILEGESQGNNYNRLTWAGPITLTANSTLFQYGANNGQMSQGVNVAGPLNMNGYTLTNSGISGLYSGSIISGPISGTGTILETVNNLYLQGTNTFSGTFRAVGGTLSVQNVYALQNATLDMNAADAGSVNLNNNNAIIGGLTGSLNLNLGSGNIWIGNNNANTTYSGALTNTGSITKVGSGTLTLSGANTYTGNTTISGGTLALSGSGSIATTPTLTIATNATIDVSAVTGPGYANPSGRTLAFNIDKTSGTRTQGQLTIGAIHLTYGGPLSVTKSGSDTLSSGDSFILVTKSTGTLGGWFSSVSLPALSAGLSWDTNGLATTGVLTVYDFTTTPLAISTPINSNAVVLAGKLATHAASALGTPVAMAIGTAATNGTASVSGGDLTYAPNTGFTGDDHFTVIFQDGSGTQTMAVSVTVGYGTGMSPNLLGQGAAGGNFVLKFAGYPGETYTVETNPVVGPGWGKLGNVTAPDDGIISVTNAMGTNSLFFRTVWPSY